MRQREDLDYADDIALISSTWTQAQTNLERLRSNSEGTGLKINIDKTKVLRLNARRQDPIKPNGTDVEDTDSFVYLGATVNNLGGAEQDIRSRLGKARSVFHRLSKEFAGNTDKNNVVYHELIPPIRARYIRFLPVAWIDHISMRVEVYGCPPGCTAPAVGMETGKISDSQITATAGDPLGARLNKPFVCCVNVGGYIQIDLGRLYRICAVATQGNPGGNYDYLKEYKVSWSKDGVTWDMSAQVLKGNINWRDVRKNHIPVIYARYFRLLPLKWFVWPCTRMEVYGEPWPEVSEALFTPIGVGKALSGHEISSLTAVDAIKCMKLCLVTEQCKSFNFSDKLQKCEVNAAKAEKSSLEDREGFNYFEASP
ncbi:hypothetical protein ACROYT_G013638 [Oculina patagonica]